MNTSFPPAEFDENPNRPVSIGEATEQLLGALLGGASLVYATCQVFESDEIANSCGTMLRSMKCTMLKLEHSWAFWPPGFPPVMKSLVPPRS